ncbi:PhzF family phenazine biosynthesis protein [Paenibacillus mendelii]|uniref:PhzF family phenazine biosynthesis protein n=1 Tax=Paenibacillus mendelii TaxID=206163 RepID=A0ABV6J632_9BACL|nr:PhzF family phenazine biosynthesis protein [Paenibacillus mendelii]MCQ6559951.1 PhzF family phenazine biosynthesis protein [Paenibacillus mendelii]
MNQEIDFVICNPANNMAILVMNEFPANQHARIAAQMMVYGHLYAEQVGFVESPTLPGCTAKLRMAGGEFCGNACLALAACLADQSSIRSGENMELALECSSAELPVHCLVEKLDRDYRCEADMPVPKRVERVILSRAACLLMASSDTG